MPSPLGWGFNQVLWRKADERMLRGRVADMRRLFTSTSLDDVRPILNGYQIDYVFYGEVERLEGWYGDIGEQKFIDAGFPVVCDFGSARVYEVLR